MARKNVIVRKAVLFTPGVASVIGVVSTASSNTVSTLFSAVRALTGVATTGASGTTSIGTVGSVSRTPTGVAATGAGGTTSIGTVGSVSRTPTGVAATGASGTTSISAVGSVSRTPTGVATTGASGTTSISTTGSVSRTPTGVAATGSAGTAIGGNNTVVAALSASRITGVAPLAVQFDATGTVNSGATISSNPNAIFRDIGYYFTYGDTASGNWTYSQNGTNVSKNYDRGAPLGAHVYETPGTYVAKVRARTSTGAVSDAQVTITVTDPNTVYSGTNTVCLSRTSDHTGAPAGASLLSNVSAWPTFNSNTRYLLHAGQSFTTLGRPNIAGATATKTGIRIGKYGSGADPVINGLSIDGEPPGASRTTWSSDIAISDLNLNGSTLTSTQSHTDVLCLRCTNISGGAGNIAIELGAAVQWYASPGNSGATTAANIYFPIRTFIVECNVSNGVYGITSFGRGTTVLGTVVQTSVQHNFRFWNAYKGIFRHNSLANAGSGQHNIKLHASGYTAWVDTVNGSSNESAYNVISENYIGAAGQANPWSVAVGPEASDLPDQGIRDSIVENNYFVYNYPVEVMLGGLRLTSRGNTGVGAVNEGTDLHAGGIPPGWDTGYSTGGPSITTEAPI